MNELIKFEGKKFSSLYIADQINAFRYAEGTKSRLRHSDLLRKIELEFDGRNISYVNYKDTKGELRKAFELTEKQSLIMLMGESRFVRQKVADILEAQALEIQKLKIEAIEAEKRFLTAQNDRLHDKLDQRDLYNR